VGTAGSLKQILHGPATLDDGTQNFVGSIRTCMGAVALRVRFKRIESGPHQVRIGVVNADGKSVIPPFQTTMNIQVREPQEAAVANLILNLANVTLGGYGRYAVDLAVDGRQEGSLPFFVRSIANPSVEPQQP
jgi:hypothetical protein